VKCLDLIRGKETEFFLDNLLALVRFIIEIM
jgi:hypothetical protein